MLRRGTHLPGESGRPGVLCRRPRRRAAPRERRSLLFLIRPRSGARRPRRRDDPSPHPKASVRSGRATAWRW